MRGGASRPSRALSRTAVDAAGLPDGQFRIRTTEACGPGTPGLVLSFAENLRGDGDYEVTDTGESAHNAVKTIAQGKPDCSVYL
jgi:hypothetical protein